ncbi:MAG TPA: glycosyltransferase family 39 protein [Chloroflexia bacterium]
MERNKPAADPQQAPPTGDGAQKPLSLERAWHTRDLVLALPALLLCGVGEVLLFDNGLRDFGAILLTIGVLLGVLAWSHTRDKPIRVAGQGPRTLPAKRRSALRVVGIGAALSLASGGVLAWFAQPGAVFGLQGVLWLASITVFLLSCYRWHTAGELAVCAASTYVAWTRAERLVFGGLVVLALCTYLIALDTIPWYFHQDEVVAHYEAWRFYNGPPISLLTTTWFETSLPSLPFAFTGNLMHLVGTGLAGVRVGIAFIGALAVVPTYGIARLLWGRVAAAVAGFAWATSPVAIHYSRISIVNITTATCWAVCFYFLLHGLRTHRPMSFALSGLAAGLSMYTFYGTRLLPYLLVAFAAYLALFHFRTFREQLGNLGLLAAGFLIGFGPLLAYFLRYPGMWAGRGLSQLNVPAAIPTTWEAMVHDWNVLAPLMVENFLSLSVLPSRDNFYWAPFLSPVEAVLLLLGVGVLASRWRQLGAFLVLLWGAGIVFVGGTLIDRGHIPSFVHWTPAFPAFFLALALPVSLLFKSLLRYRPNLRYAGGVLLAAGLCLLAVTNLYCYVVVYPAQVPPAFGPAVGRFLATLPRNSQVRLVGNLSPPYSSVTGRMLAPGVTVGELLNPSLELPLLPDPTREFVFIFDEDQAHYLPVVQSYYPGGEVRPLQTPGGTIGSAYLLPRGATAGRQGVQVTLAGGDGNVLHQGQVHTVGAMPGEFSVRYPVTATWSGALYVPRRGPIRLHLEGSGWGQLLLGGQPGRLDTPTYVERGWLAFCVRVPVEGASKVRLLVQEEGGPATEVETTVLWPQSCEVGLSVALNGGDVTHRVDPFVGAGVLSPDDFTFDGLISKPSERDLDFVPLASDVAGVPRLRWEGEVDADGGAYRMELRTDGRATLAIDGTSLVTVCSKPLTVQTFFGRGTYPWEGATINLTPGWHKVRLDFIATGNANGLEWRWTRPDGVTEIVPPNRLRHSLNFDAMPSTPLSPPESIDCPSRK